MTRNALFEKDFYRTSDLALATAVSLFHPVESIDRQDYRKASFVFRHNEKLEQLIGSYWRGELKVEPQAYFNQLRVIKARLYSEE